MSDSNNKMYHHQLQQQPPPPPTRSRSSSSNTTSMRQQARALARKSFKLQAANLWANVCIVSAPILFCVLLLLLQLGMMKLMSGEDFQCGCQCTKCCYGGDSSNCSVMHNSTCPYTCLERNSSNCGLQYSAGTQVAFCDIPHTSAWPPIVQTPPEKHRAAVHRPKVTMLYTPGSNATLSEQLTAGLLPQPALQASTILAAQKYLMDFAQNMSGSVTIPGEAFSMLGLKRLGSSSVMSMYTGLYVETALVEATRSLYMLWPDGTCKQLGLEGHQPTNLTTALQALVNVSNPPAAAALINSRIGGLVSDSTAGSASSIVQQVAGMPVNCTDVVMERLSTPKRLQRALFCGNRLAACNGSKVTNSFAAAFDWANTSTSSFQPLVFFNDTYGMPDDGADIGTKYMRTPQLLNMAVNSWLASVLGNGVSAELLGVGALPLKAAPFSLDYTPVLGPLLAAWVLQLLLPVFVSQLVQEKSMRMYMKMHGMQDGAYWLVQYSWFLLLYVAYAAAFLAFGAITNLAVFTLNSYGVQIGLLFIWGNTMIALALLISCLFSHPRTATVFCYMLVFASGLIGYLMMRVLLDLQVLSADNGWVEALQVLPPLALYRGLYELGSYAWLGQKCSDIGMAPSMLHDSSNGMLGVWGMLAAEWAVMMVLAWYLEQVYASGTGNRRDPLYFLECFRTSRKAKTQDAGSELYTAASSSLDAALPVSFRPGSAAPPPPPPQRTTSGFEAVFSYSAPLRVSPINTTCALHTLSPKHTPGSSSNKGDGNSGNGNTLPPRPSISKLAPHPGPGSPSAAVVEPPDVAEERLHAAAVDDYEQHPLVIRALHKVYPAQDGQPPKLAVRRLDLAVRKGECVGLLGPNGAGKSSSLSMLVGLQEPTSGTAIIGGHDLRGGMRPIYGIMGLCPQHDLLWATLSGREHMIFYGTLKGLAGPELDATVEDCLKAVKLWSHGVADKPAGSYSGGMQRRLSVAIALMGNPKVVYLDEPSTGLDPASRRVLWDAVKAAKPGRAIILTTHNMEEAEVLCDRLGIFVSGRMACIGHPKDITSRFCGFLLFTISVSAGKEAEARQLVSDLAPAAQLTYSVGGTLKYELPTDQVSLSCVFATMAGARAAELDVLDWSVANAGLEDCFIRIAQQMNIKAT